MTGRNAGDPTERRNVDQQASDIDQTDEEILSCIVSDEALEAAAGTEKGTNITIFDFFSYHYRCC